MTAADIRVRPVKFEFPEQIDVMAMPGDIAGSAGMVGFSFTLPYLEPYLIRTMTIAKGHTKDPDLLADMRAFSKQEGHHFKNHKRINELVKTQLPDWCAEELSDIEQQLNDDYQRFTKDKSLRWNLAYAEGFEAMTFAMAQNSFENREVELAEDRMEQNWSDLYEWHLAEEIEHRNVAYDAYYKIYGGYFYRLVVGVRAQAHFLNYVGRFAKVVAKGLREQGRAPETETQSQGGLTLPPQYWRTLSPWYNPSNIDISETIQDLLKKWDMAY